MRFYNTLTREKEEFRPVSPGRVGIYTCGPTVYMFAHIGNFRAYVFADTLRRACEYSGLAVRHVMNVTDVGHLTSDEDSGEDKFDKSARREGKTPAEIARFYEAAFFADSAKLNLLRPHVVCRATEHIPEMVELIRRIEANGFAYRTSVGLIFDTGRYPDYARLSRLNLAEQQAGARVAVDPERRNPSDFALWITNQPKHLMQWDSPWGRGFPGWHVECSAMSMKYLGETLDIHTGAVDNVFPHHENEVAQSEGATGKTFVRFWLHAEHLIVDGEKMAKSKGNFYTLPDVLSRGFSPRAVRYLLLSVPYRQKLNFTFDALRGAVSALERLESLEARLRERAGAVGAEGASEAFRGRVEEAKRAVQDAWEDDLNSAAALGALFAFVKEANTALEGGLLAPADAASARALLREADGVLGVLAPAEDASLEAEVEAKIAARQEARKRRDFAASDAIRDELAARGILLEDTPQGVRWRRKS